MRGQTRNWKKRGGWKAWTAQKTSDTIRKRHLQLNEFDQKPLVLAVGKAEVGKIIEVKERFSLGRMPGTKDSR